MFSTFFMSSPQKKIWQEAKVILENLRRNLATQRDLLSQKQIGAVNEWVAQYVQLIKVRNYEALEPLNAEVVKSGTKIFPPNPYADIAENVEVFVVAAIMALAIRTFILQPFMIPTGSMEPTLSGIEPVRVPDDQDPPGVLTQAYDLVIHGRSYQKIVTKTGGHITDVHPGLFSNMWIQYTVVTLQNDQGQTETDTIWVNDDGRKKLGLELSLQNKKTGAFEGTVYPPGVLTNYICQAGDVVLVDKVSFNFRKPHRGDVIIFKTLGISSISDNNILQPGNSLDFIKRCTGLPGDKITVSPPNLYYNGKLEDGSTVFQKQFAQADPYAGYFHISKIDSYLPVTEDVSGGQTWVVPNHCYWAMGDNSADSLDSRYWGGVPEQNLAGRGCFVLWPLTERWGFIP